MIGKKKRYLGTTYDVHESARDFDKQALLLHGLKVSEKSANQLQGENKLFLHERGNNLVCPGTSKRGTL